MDKQSVTLGLAVKRLIDLLLGVPLFLLFLPLGVILAIAVKLDSQGPILFIQDRRGKHFQTFKVVKFRTLQHNMPDPHERYEMLERDPRITRVGYFLRKTSLDELPQLINVLAGSMSLVGPRPLVEWESQKSLPRFAARFGMKPGLTGLSQLSGRNSIDFDQRCAKDVEYVRRWSVLLDCVLLAKTPMYLAKTHTIYPEPEPRVSRQVRGS